MATVRTIQSVSEIVTTSNATITTLASVTLPTGAVVIADLFVSAKTGALSGAGWSVVATFKNNGGTVAQVGATLTTLSVQDVALATALVTVDVTGATFRVRVTGIAATPIEWYVTGTIHFN